MSARLFQIKHSVHQVFLQTVHRISALSSGRFSVGLTQSKSLAFGLFRSYVVLYSVHQLVGWLLKSGTGWNGMERFCLLKYGTHGTEQQAQRNALCAHVHGEEKIRHYIYNF